MIQQVVFTARLTGIPQYEKTVMIAAPTVETISAARMRRSVNPSGSNVESQVAFSIQSSARTSDAHSSQSAIDTSC
jgi:hypothetical protein